MYANNTIHGFILLTCVLCYFLSPEKGIKVSVQEVSAKEVNTTTGTVQAGVGTQVQAGGKKTESEKRVECNTDCKVKTLIDLGYNEKVSGSLVYTCKDKATDPRHCILIGASILKAESGGGNKCYKNGCFGILAGGISYKTLEDGVEDWVTRYTKYWYRQENPSGFYSNSPNWKPKTHYCMSEYQSNGTKLSYCKNGHKHAWSAFNTIRAKF